MSGSQAAVIDSSLAVYSVLNVSQSAQAERVFERLLNQKIRLFVPRLWIFEVTSIIHKYLFDKLITPKRAFDSLSVILGFEKNLVDEDQQLCQLAFEWATRLRQKPAYDGFYLAAAERLGAEFWTADEKLSNNAHQLGASWVHWMGELAE